MCVAKGLLLFFVRLNHAESFTRPCSFRMQLEVNLKSTNMHNYAGFSEDGPCLNLAYLSNLLTAMK